MAAPFFRGIFVRQILLASILLSHGEGGVVLRCVVRRGAREENGAGGGCALFCFWRWEEDGGPLPRVQLHPPPHPLHAQAAVVRQVEIIKPRARQVRSKHVPPAAPAVHGVRVQRGGAASAAGLPVGQHVVPVLIGVEIGILRGRHVLKF